MIKFVCGVFFSFSMLTLSVGQQEEHLIYKQYVVQKYQRFDSCRSSELFYADIASNKIELQ